MAKLGKVVVGIKEGIKGFEGVEKRYIKQWTEEGRKVDWTDLANAGNFGTKKQAEQNIAGAKHTEIGGIPKDQLEIKEV